MRVSRTDGRAELDAPLRSFVNMMPALLHRSGTAALLAVSLLAIPVAADAAACRDEADRLSARHRLDQAPNAPPPQEATHVRAKEHIDAARKADDDGVLEECLRQLAQARTVIEGPIPGNNR